MIAGGGETQKGRASASPPPPHSLFLLTLSANISAMVRDRKKLQETKMISVKFSIDWSNKNCKNLKKLFLFKKFFKFFSARTFLFYFTLLFPKNSNTFQMPLPLCRCRVLYIGSSVPTITKDGLQGIQQPLKERYPIQESPDTRGIDSW